MYTQVPGNASGLNQDPLKEKSMAVFSMHNAVVYSKNVSPNIWVICNITYFAILFLLFLDIIPFILLPSSVWLKLSFHPKHPEIEMTSFIIAQGSTLDSSILLPHYQITVVSLHINCAYLCQPGLVL